MLKNKILLSFTGFVTGCDPVSSALFTGFEILHPYKRLENKILFHRFSQLFFLTGCISLVFSWVFSQVLTLQKVPCSQVLKISQPVKKTHENGYFKVFFIG